MKGNNSGAIPLPEIPKIISQDKKRNLAIFEISPCYPGYGMTLGNTFRRVLLSSLSGAAVTAIKVEKVNHEFSGIPHVKEDMIELMLNFKKLRVKSFSDSAQKMTLNVKGVKEVSAKDIKAPADIEIINQDLHLASLTDKKAELNIEIEVQKGIGYSSAEEREKSKQEIGKVLLDAIFTPIQRVNYTVENVRVHDRTDFNKITMEIETDGSIAPEEAFKEAAEILVDHFKLFVSPQKQRQVEKDIAVLEKEKSPKKKSVARVSVNIEDLKLNSRIITVLEDNRIKSVTSLVKKSENQLLNLDGLGEKAIKNIKRELGKLGLVLKQE